MSQKIPGKDKIHLARFRLGNEVKAAEFWKRKEQILCRLCGEGLETMQHIMQECGKMRWKDRKWTIAELLSEDGVGLDGLRQLEVFRKECERKEERILTARQQGRTVVSKDGGQ